MGEREEASLAASTKLKPGKMNLSEFGAHYGIPDEALANLRQSDKARLIALHYEASRYKRGLEAVAESRKQLAQSEAKTAKWAESAVEFHSLMKEKLGIDLSETPTTN